MKKLTKAMKWATGLLLVAILVVIGLFWGLNKAVSDIGGGGYEPPEIRNPDFGIGSPRRPSSSTVEAESEVSEQPEPAELTPEELVEEIRGHILRQLSTCEERVQELNEFEERFTPQQWRSLQNHYWSSIGAPEVPFGEDPSQEHLSFWHGDYVGQKSTILQRIVELNERLNELEGVVLEEEALRDFFERWKVFIRRSAPRSPVWIIQSYIADGGEISH